ncbi:DUF4169 family protein [Litorisediminicola beolgyonensis]|uniref:DUF4169 family protein n=1 Tax=Litorisediminicola beolgyonensis TaxID=1173614 RepID=A0ABW3ZKD1_9RHOB
MATPINLNKHRKEKARAEKRKAADANAVKFGRSLAERRLDQARAEKSARELDGKKRE